MQIEVRIPTDAGFDYEGCRKMFNDNCKAMREPTPFSSVVKNAWFYSFYHDNTLLGCIYLYHKNDRLFLNAFAGRKHHLINLECLKQVPDWFNCDIYAETSHKTAKLCLKKCGYEKISDTTYIKRKVA